MSGDELKTEVEKLVAVLKTANDSAGSARVRLGSLLFQVRASRAWKEWGHKNFGAYIKATGKEIEKGHTQLYAFIGIAERLEPVMGAATLAKVPFLKASELSKAVRREKHPPSEALIKLALDPRVKTREFQAAVAEEYLGRPTDPKYQWYSFGGAYLDPDKQQTIEKAFALAVQVDPVIPHDIPDHVIRGEVLFRLAQEFIAAYAPEVGSLPSPASEEASFGVEAL